MTEKKSALVILLVAFLSLAGLGQAASDSDVGMKYRAAWMHPGQFGADQAAALPKMQKTLDEYVLAGIDTLVMLVKNTSGYVYFKSQVGVMDPAYDWDFLDVFLKEARKRNLTVHPWFCVFPETAIVGKVRENPEWLIKGRADEMVGAANPALPEVRKYELDLMMEVVRRYPVDWIHLDYIRFPCAPAEPYFSFDARTRELFKEHTGIDVLTLKAKDSGNIFWNEWLEWNRDKVTLFVQELKDALKGCGRKVMISAAVFPDPDNAAVLIGQDWPRWAREGLIDMLCPMLYIDNMALFEKYVRKAVHIGKGRCFVLPGIGIRSSHNQNTPERMIEQMKVCKKAGSDGVIYFSSYSLNEPFLEKLKAAK
ncbi:MAG: family 10 glycosylhydrolase [Acidobacteriota bacterium]|nr:family 10 glycosylhydrolase [Acidobacteriota bacterium]